MINSTLVFVDFIVKLIEWIFIEPISPIIAPAKILIVVLPPLVLVGECFIGSR